MKIENENLNVKLNNAINAIEKIKKENNDLKNEINNEQSKEDSLKYFESENKKIEDRLSKALNNVEMEKELRLKLNDRYIKNKAN